MKLPQDIVGIYREGRTDAFTSAGVEALWLKSAWKRVKKVARKVGGVARRVGRFAWKQKCLACYAIPNPAAAIACQVGCGLISRK